MGLTLADIDALRAKQRDPIAVGEFPDSIRIKLGLRVPIVYLSETGLSHIKQRHPDIDDFDLLILPFAIRHGLILRELKKPQIVLSCYQEPTSHRRFVAVMKVLDKKFEVWLTSLYRTKPKQTKQLMKKCEKSKDHD